MSSIPIGLEYHFKCRWSPGHKIGWDRPVVRSFIDEVASDHDGFAVL